MLTEETKTLAGVVNTKQPTETVSEPAAHAEPPRSINVLDHGYVKEIEHYGSDERIIESARMSTDGAFRGWDSDARLLGYLWRNKHYSPFEFCGLTVEIQCPLFVAREWHRHRTQSYNELSARYTELPDLYYIPSVERLAGGGQSRTNRQGSEDRFSADQAGAIRSRIEGATVSARAVYESLLAQGLSRELARVVIPVNQYTRFRAASNLRNWLGFLQLRLDDSAQCEIREYARAVGSIIKERFPRTYDLFDRESQES